MIRHGPICKAISHKPEEDGWFNDISLRDTNA